MKDTQPDEASPQSSSNSQENDGATLHRHTVSLSFTLPWVLAVSRFSHETTFICCLPQGCPREHKRPRRQRRP
jgi:hypothetical protein